MRKELAEFSLVCNDNSLLSKNKNNKIIRAFYDTIKSKVYFPKIDISKMVFFGYPKESYLVERFNKFESIIANANKMSYDELKKTEYEFLQSCHGGETLTDENGVKLAKKNLREVDYYKACFDKSECISHKLLTKEFSSLFDNEEQKVNNAIYFRPFGFVVSVSCNKGLFNINDNQNYRVDFDFLKINANINFEALFIISPRWFKKDHLYYSSREEKFNDLLLNNNISKHNAKIYIQSSSNSTLVSNTYNLNGIKTSILKELSSIEDNAMEALKKDKLIVKGNCVYIPKLCDGNKIEIVNSDYVYNEYKTKDILIPRNK